MCFWYNLLNYLRGSWSVVLKKSFKMVAIFSMNPAIQWISIKEIKCAIQGRANLSGGKRYPPGPGCSKLG